MSSFSPEEVLRPLRVMDEWTRWKKKGVFSLSKGTGKVQADQTASGEGKQETWEEEDVLQHGQDLWKSTDNRVQNPSIDATVGLLQVQDYP